MSIIVSLLKTNACQCGHLFLDHGSHTSLLLRALSPVSTFGPLEPASSKLLLARDSIFQSKTSFCPKLSGRGGEFFLHFQAICLHKQGLSSPSSRPNWLFDHELPARLGLHHAMFHGETNVRRDLPPSHELIVLPCGVQRPRRGKHCRRK